MLCICFLPICCCVAVDSLCCWFCFCLCCFVVAGFLLCFCFALVCFCFVCALHVLLLSINCSLRSGWLALSGKGHMLSAKSFRKCKSANLNPRCLDLKLQPNVDRCRVSICNMCVCVQNPPRAFLKVPGPLGTKGFCEIFRFCLCGSL